MDETSHISINSESMKTRQELVTDAIRKAILFGKFRPGDKLDQSELANELNVSRSPVRDAMRTLAAEELITYYPHRGNVVTERSLAELQELLFMRKLLEGVATRRAATAMTDEILDTLQGIITKAEASGDMNRLLAFNNKFHITLYSAYAQPFLVAQIQKMRNKMAPYNRVYLDIPGEVQSAWEDHRRIFDACAVRDADAAEEETNLHLDRVLKKIVNALEIK